MMNALEAIERMEKLRNRINALARIVAYMDDDRDFADDIDVLKELQKYAESEYSNLADKLRSVNL
jgi:hypothetical protein